MRIFADSEHTDTVIVAKREVCSVDDELFKNTCVHFEIGIIDLAFTASGDLKLLSRIISRIRPTYLNASETK
jgi:hypothetical protein